MSPLHALPQHSLRMMQKTQLSASRARDETGAQRKSQPHLCVVFCQSSAHHQSCEAANFLLIIELLCAVPAEIHRQAQ